MIKMNLKLFIICTAIVLSLMSLADADSTATIHGAVYKMDTFEPLDNAVIEVNSTPTQYMVAKNGHYSVELLPGNYTITARYYEDNTLIYAVVDTIIIETGGDYVYDLLLPPVNSENQIESEKKSITDTSMDEINNSNGLILTNRSLGSVAEKQKTADGPFFSNLINNLQTLVTRQSRLYPSINFILIGFAVCFLLIGSYFLLRNYEQIKNNDVKKGKNGHIIRNPFERVNIRKALGKVSAKDTGSEVKPESGGNNEEAVSATEVESKIRDRSVPGLEHYPARKTELAESVSEEDKRRILLEELASNPEIETPSLKKKLLLPADLQEILDVIKSQGGLISQKDLRSKLNYSEVKVSVMLTDLEKMKRIKKFKRGRENFVVLIDWKR
jgi:uncharacterized membrane protein